MLNAYLAQFQALIQAPSSPVPLITPAQATTYINDAREQVAAEGECLRAISTMTLAIDQILYGFGAIIPPAGSGYQAPIAVRMLWNGATLIDLRPWEWFSTYYSAPTQVGAPVRAAQQGQGSRGSLWINPIPDNTYQLSLDTALLPIPLVDDTTIEAIPYPWTDAVPFWAAWLGMQSLQRQTDADMMMARYQVLMHRARGESVPSVLPGNLPGDLGTKLAAAKTTLTEAQAPAGAGR